MQVFERKFCLLQSVKGDRPKKIQCRNAYERKMIHNKADELGINHYTIIDKDDYWVFYKQSMGCSQCIGYCPNREIVIQPRPKSYVVLNDSNKKILQSYTHHRQESENKFIVFNESERDFKELEVNDSTLHPHKLLKWTKQQIRKLE